MNIGFNGNILQSMNEGVGEMDNTYGYSSGKLSKYFNNVYPPSSMEMVSLDDDDDEEDEDVQEFYLQVVLSKVSEILTVFESMKSWVVHKYKGYFTVEELAEIFDFYCDGFMDLRDSFITYQEKNSFLSSIEDHGTSYRKVKKMDPFEFFILAYMIVESWNSEGCPIERPTLFEKLASGSKE